MFNVFDCNDKYTSPTKNFQCINFSHYQDENENPNVCIGDHIYQKDVLLEETEILIRIAQVEWYRLQDAIFYSSTLSCSEILYSRETINKTFHAMIQSIDKCHSQLQRDRYIVSVMDSIKKLSTSVIRIKQFEDDILLKLSTPSMANVKGPLYQYFHLFLDVQYYLLKIDYICCECEENLNIRITQIMEDLLILSKKNYKRNNSNAFICNCMKKFWLAIKTFTEKKGLDNNSFWDIFNVLLKNEEPIFSLWILKHVCDRNEDSIGFKPNYTLLEAKIKEILLNANCSVVTKCLKIVEPLLCDLWLDTPRIEVFQLMWDYFSKRLNISNKQPRQTVFELIDLFYTVNGSPKDCTEDFEMFIGMLVCHLRKHPTQWGKMKGRIYSQLSPNKLKDLNEIGISHVMLLFLSLASVNYNELSKRILSFFEHLPVDKLYTNLVWNCYIVFIIIHLKEGNDLQEISSPILQMLQYASYEKLFNLLKEFTINFTHIINHSKNTHLHQWLLLNSWLSKYLMTCQYQDLKIALDTLLYTLNKVDNPESWLYWESTYKEFVYPTLKQLCNSPNPPDIIGQISGKLCLLIRDICTDCLNYFTGENISSKVTYQFLNVVLDNYPSSFILTAQQMSMVIQSWTKICLLHPDLCEDLTNNILKLDTFPDTLKIHMKNSKDPFCALIEYLGSDLKTHTQSNAIIRLCEIAFGDNDKWLPQYLKEPDNEATVYRIYTCMSLAFLHCGVLLYDRNKSISPLTKLVQVLLLPTRFLMGKPLHVFVLNAIKKTWHIFFEAVVKLNNISDTFLDRTLRDMIAKYVFYFPTSESPIVKCLENETTAAALLDKICYLYFKQQVREPETNILKVLNILTTFIQSTSSLTFMKLFVNKTLVGLYEVIIFHPQRNVATNLVKMITGSILFPQIKTEFNKSVLDITEKHMAFNATLYFRLMNTLARFVPDDIKKLLCDIKKQISNVERLRGIGFDKNLRTLFEELELSANDHE